MGVYVCCGARGVVSPDLVRLIQHFLCETESQESVGMPTHHTSDLFVLLSGHGVLTRGHVVSLWNVAIAFMRSEKERHCEQFGTEIFATGFKVGLVRRYIYEPSQRAISILDRLCDFSRSSGVSDDSQDIVAEAVEHIDVSGLRDFISCNPKFVMDLKFLQPFPRLKQLFKIRFFGRLLDQKQLPLKQLESLWRGRQHHNCRPDSLRTTCGVFWQQLAANLSSPMVEFLTKSITKMDPEQLTREHLRLVCCSLCVNVDQESVQKCVNFLWTLIRDENESLCHRVSDLAIEWLCRISSSRLARTVGIPKAVFVTAMKLMCEAMTRSCSGVAKSRRRGKDRAVGAASMAVSRWCARLSNIRTYAHVLQEALDTLTEDIRESLIQRLQKEERLVDRCVGEIESIYQDSVDNECVADVKGTEQVLNLLVFLVEKSRELSMSPHQKMELYKISDMKTAQAKQMRKMIRDALQKVVAAETERPSIQHRVSTRQRLKMIGRQLWTGSGKDDERDDVWDFVRVFYLFVW